MSIRALILAALAPLALGCGLIPSGGGADRPAVELDASAPRSTQIAVEQEGIELQAEFEGNRLWFQIDNFEVDGLLVAPESFAVGAHEREVHYSRDEDVLTRFPPQVLDRGASMAGEMVVLPVESLENYRLFYHSTQTTPRNWSCEILPRRARPEAEEPPTDEGPSPEGP